MLRIYIFSAISSKIEDRKNVKQKPILVIRLCHVICTRLMFHHTKNQDKKRTITTFLHLLFLCARRTSDGFLVICTPPWVQMKTQNHLYL